MQRSSRRTILASVVGYSTVVFSGCAHIRPEDGQSFAYFAEVVDQQSESTPATIRTKLTTESGETEISSRETIVLRYEDGPGYNIILIPETDVGPNQPPEGPSGGCWRYTDNDFLARDMEEWHSVDSSEGFQETYSLFTRGEGGHCLPDGDYLFVSTIRDKSRNELQVFVDISITDGHVSAAGSIQS